MSDKHLFSVNDSRMAILWLPGLAALAGLAAFLPTGISAVGPITFLFITLATVLSSTFLLRFEWQECSPLAQRLAVTMSSLSPVTPLSPLSYFTSFTGNLMILLLAGLIDPVNDLLLCWLNIFVVPYVLFAVFYQKRPVRQWCIMYLGLPVVLAGVPLTTPDSPVVLKMIVLLVLPFLAAMLQVKSFRKNQENGLQPGHS